MSMTFQNLDETTRGYMLTELEGDVETESLYLSARLTDDGRDAYTDLLRAAITDGTEVTLGQAIREGGFLREVELRNTARGTIEARVPETAAMTLAEGEFNRFYCRGLAARATDEAIENLVIYRAKAVEKPRSDSEALVGTSILTTEVLVSSREQPGKTASGIPHGPNSGLSIAFR